VTGDLQSFSRSAPAQDPTRSSYEEAQDYSTLTRPNLLTVIHRSPFPEKRSL